MSLNDDIDKWMNRINELKRKLRVGLYGAYYPSSELRRLRRLRDCLRKKGYNVLLAEDLGGRPEFTDDRQRSVFLLENSHVNVFVFTFRGKNQGTISELEHVLRNRELVAKSVVCVESEGGRKAITSLILGLGILNIIEFKRGDDLCRLVEGILRNHLFYNFYYFRDRL